MFIGDGLRRMQVTLVGQYVEVFLTRENLANGSLSNTPFVSSGTINKSSCSYAPCFYNTLSATGDVEMTSGFFVGSEAKLTYFVKDIGSFGIRLAKFYLRYTIGKTLIRCSINRFF
jgi:hypothetical protein